MSDDSFIREVNEELRSERAKAAWRRFGPLGIGLVVLVVVAVAGWEAYRYYERGQSAQYGDALMTAMNGIEGGDPAAMQQLSELEAEGPGAYPVLAQMRRASFLSSEGQAAEAVQLFDQIASNGSAPQVLRDLAALRAGYILVDAGSYDDVSARVQRLSTDDAPMRFSAREALGLAAWKAERLEEAFGFFRGLSTDPQAPANLRQRALIMEAYLAGRGIEAPEEPA